MALAEDHDVREELAPAVSEPTSSSGGRVGSFFSVVADQCCDDPALG